MSVPVPPEFIGVFDKNTGKITYAFDLDYACTRFTLCGDFLMGANMDMIDLSEGHRLIATGPAVDSRVVRLVPWARDPVAVTDSRCFAQVVRSAFGQRRKTLRNALRALLDRDAIEACGIDSQARAQTLGLQAFADLSNALHEQQRRN